MDKGPNNIKEDFKMSNYNNNNRNHNRTNNSNNSNRNNNNNNNNNKNRNNNNRNNNNNNRLSLHELQQDKEVLDHLRDRNESPEVKAEWFYQTLDHNKTQLTHAEQKAVNLDTENTQLKDQLLALTKALTETEKQWSRKEQALRQELQASNKRGKRHEKNFIKSKRENANLKVRTARQEELFNEARERCRQMGQNAKHRNKSLKDLQNQLVRYSKEVGEAKKELHQSLQRSSSSDESVESLNDKLEEENSCLNEKLRRAVRMASAQDDALYLVAKGKSKEEVQNKNKKNDSKRNSQQDDEMVDVLDESNRSHLLEGFSQKLAAFTNYAKRSHGYDTAYDHDMADLSADPHNDPRTGKRWWRGGEEETPEERKKRKKREIPQSMVAQLWNQPRENMLVDQGSSVWVEEPRVPLYLPPTPTEPRFEARSRKRGFADFSLEGEAMAPDPILEMGDHLKRMRMGDLEFDFEWPSQAPDSGFMAITKMLDDMNVSRTYLDEITPETALEQFLVVIQTAMTTEMQRTPTIEELLEKVVWYLKDASAVNFNQLQSRLQQSQAPALPPPPLVPEARVISVKQPTEQASTAPTKVLPREKTRFVGPSYLPPKHKPTMLRSSFPTTAKEWTKLSADQDYRKEAEVHKAADPSESEYVLQPHEPRDFRKFGGAIDFDPPKQRPWLRRLGYAGGFCALVYIALSRYYAAQNPASLWMDSNEVPLELLRVLRKSHFDEREIVQIMRYGAARFADINAGILG
ncbi:hypothetical protein BO99DRAFT_102886 [Aspergillus violaceofuscus CBS 115571]|uniref:Uncharacterized protein n=1 Tax=Aspergillus violaceofuscus (strain CBS 115571) TaxID=1450538 RepID=A0A2V5HB41_ASPV1|nr:hypothetical protein BO99DRAFT_102886 [Aspergillus violaceofuscus CBS 115571]